MRNVNFSSTPHSEMALSGLAVVLCSGDGMQVVRPSVPPLGRGERAFLGLRAKGWPLEGTAC